MGGTTLQLQDFGCPNCRQWEHADCFCGIGSQQFLARVRSQRNIKFHHVSESSLECRTEIVR